MVSKRGRIFICLIKENGNKWENRVSILLLFYDNFFLFYAPLFEADIRGSLSSSPGVLHPLAYSRRHSSKVERTYAVRAPLLCCVVVGGAAGSDGERHAHARHVLHVHLALSVDTQVRRVRLVLVRFLVVLRSRVR